MPSRFATALVLAITAVFVVCLPSLALADPQASYFAAELDGPSALSTGELAVLIAVGFIPALVMIGREKRDQRRHRRPSG